MNQPVDYQPKVYCGIETIPLDHDRNAPVVAPFHEERWNRSDLPCPKAVIYTLDQGERIADKPRPCICVFNEDNDIFFHDGFYAIESKDAIAVSAVLFPALCSVLRIIPREWTKLVPTEKSQAPYMLVKVVHEGLWNIDEHPDNATDIYGPSALLVLLAQWAEMNSKNWGWSKRTRSVLGEKKATTAAAKKELNLAQEDKFPRFCRKHGLARKDKRDFEHELEGLWAAYRETQM